MTAIIDAMLVLDGISSDYLVGLSPAKAREFMERVVHYNNMEKDKMIALIDSIGALVPLMQIGEGNPNNGKPHHRFMIGNEGSRVVYLKITDTYMPKEFDYEKLTLKLKLLSHEASADEADEATGKPWMYEFRFWWD